MVFSGFSEFCGSASMEKDRSWSVCRSCAVGGGPPGGRAEIVKQGENGILFQPGDKEAIYAALTQFVCDKEQQKYMGKKSAVMIEPHFPNNVSKKLDKLYRELL